MNDEVREYERLAFTKLSHTWLCERGVCVFPWNVKRREEFEYKCGYLMSQDSERCE